MFSSNDKKKKNKRSIAINESFFDNVALAMKRVEERFSPTPWKWKCIGGNENFLILKLGQIDFQEISIAVLWMFSMPVNILAVQTLFFTSKDNRKW